MLVSVITINYNNSDGLKATIKSVLEQSYDAIEYIVIDGGSTDESLSCIKTNQDKLSYWISENDHGIYDAMNKGIKKATGHYLLFLNSGDVLADAHVITNFVNTKPVEDIVYGNVIYMHPNGNQEFVQMPEHLEGIKIFTFTLNHQCMFHKSTLFEHKRYDVNYAMLADWAFYNEAVVIDKKSYRHINLTISKYDLDGFSSQSSNQEQMKAERMLFYTRHADILMPILTEAYDKLATKHRQLKRSKFVKLALKLQKLF